MKKIISLIFVFCVICSIFALPSYASDMTESDLKAVVPSQRTLCLPFGSDITSVIFDLDADEYSIGGGEKKAFSRQTPIDVSGGKAQDVYYNTCYKIKFFKNNVPTEYSVYILSEIPSVYIGTSQGIDYIHQWKENRDKEAKILICDGEGNTVYSDISSKTSSEIKCRGNATFNYEKKPYQIKLSKKTDLFGMGKAKTWILLANYIDESNIRNAVSFKIAEALDLPFTPQSVFVNLYIDNDYLGLYQLIEKTQIGKTRVDIADLEEATEDANPDVDLDELDIRFVTNGSFIENTNLMYYTYIDGVNDPEDITGGYIIELDNLYAYREKCRFETFNKNTYVIKSPECASRAQVEYIASLVSEMEEAIYSPSGYNSKGKHYSDYADVESLLKTYMVAEMAKNWDAYVGSTFFYKDADSDGVTAKIYAGPVWDYDNAFGNQRQGTFAENKTELWAGAQKRGEYSHFGYYLIKHEEFKGKLSEYCKISAKCVYEMLAEGGYVDSLVGNLYDSIAADKARWKAKRPGTRYYLGDDTSTVLGFLKNFMKERADGLWSYFVIDDEPIPEITQTTASTTEATVETSSQTTVATTVATETASATPPVQPEKKGCAGSNPLLVIIPAAIAGGAVIFFRSRRRY